MPLEERCAAYLSLGASDDLRRGEQHSAPSSSVAALGQQQVVEVGERDDEP